MSNVTVLIAVSVDTSVLAFGADAADLADGIRARLEEFYPAGSDPVVPASVTPVVLSADGYRALLSGASVGLDDATSDGTGIPDLYLDEAWHAVTALGTARAREEAGLLI